MSPFGSTIRNRFEHNGIEKKKGQLPSPNKYRLKGTFGEGP